MKDAVCRKPIRSVEGGRVSRSTAVSHRAADRDRSPADALQHRCVDLTATNDHRAPSRGCFAGRSAMPRRTSASGAYSSEWSRSPGTRRSILPRQCALRTLKASRSPAAGRREDVFVRRDPVLSAGGERRHVDPRALRELPHLDFLDDAVWAMNFKLRFVPSGQAPHWHTARVRSA